MKQTKTKTEITVGKRQRITLRGAWSLRSGEAALKRTTARDLLRRVSFHFLDTDHGVLLVWRNSPFDSRRSLTRVSPQ